MTTQTLTGEELAEIRTTLETSRSELEAQAGSLAVSDATLAAARTSAEERPKSNGDGDQIGVERDTLASQSARVQDGLAAIDAALARLDAGTYGICAVCTDPIPAGRLLARPRSVTCIKCASKS